MKVKFIAQIIENVTDIESVEYNFKGYNSSAPVTFSQTSLQRLFDKNVYIFQMHYKSFNKTHNVVVVINYKERVEVIEFESPQDLLVV
jgi:hypothetical protein